MKKMMFPNKKKLKPPHHIYASSYVPLLHCR